LNRSKDAWDAVDDLVLAEIVAALQKETRWLVTCPTL